MSDCDEDIDGFDEFNNAATRQTHDEAFEASGGKLPRLNRTGQGSPVKGQPIRRLADLRWVDHLDSNEARDVIRSAKAGDPVAKERLVKCYQKTLIKIAGRSKYDGPAFEDRLEAAWAGFWKALAGYSLNSNNGFYAYAVKFITGAVVDCVHDHHYKGGMLETTAARKDRAGHKPVHVEYNAVEQRFDQGGRDADGERYGNAITGHIASDDKELQWCDGSEGKVTDAAWDRIVEGRKVPTVWCPNHFSRGCRIPEPSKGTSRDTPEPCKPISRERYEEDQARAYKFDTAAYVQQGLSARFANIGRNLGVPRECIGVDQNFHRNGTIAPALGIIGYLAKDADARALRRLKQVGRVQYAQELVAKDRDTVANRPLQRHLYAGAVPKPLKWNRSKRNAPLTEESQHSLKSKLRLIKGIQHGQFNHPGTVNSALHSSALHRNDRGDRRGIRKAGGTGS